MGWYRDASGKPVWVADNAAPAVVPVGPRKATAPYEAPKAAAEVVQTQAQATRTRGQEVRDSQLQPFAVRKAAADAAKAEAEARSVNGLDRQKLANIRAVQAQIDRMQELYRQGPGRTQGLAGVLDYLPTPRNKQFDTAGAGLGEMGLAAFRVPGVGSQSDTELRAFIDANRPSASDYDAQIQEKLNNLQGRLNQTYAAYGIQRPGKKGKAKGGWQIERIDD